MAEAIFANLNNKNLVRCKEVSRDWNDFLGNQKFLLIRKIQKTLETRRKFGKPWKSIVKDANIETLISLEAAASQFFANTMNFFLALI